MENIIWNENNGVPFLTFPSFKKLHVTHGVSTKLGGVSKGDCATMNMSFTRGDNEDNVQKNQERFAVALGYDKSKVVLSDQVHDTKIYTVTSDDYGKGVERSSDIIGVDGLITEDKDAVLMIFFADCVPLFFYDPVHQAIGAAHSGWRGTVAHMGMYMIEAMEREFGTQPSDVHAVIGPSVCQNCYEVSEEVVEQFCHSFPKEQWGKLWEDKGNDKYQLNLWEANRVILRDAGIPDAQIEISGYCTCCHSDILFSHRATAGRRGNLSGVITLGGTHE